MVQTMVYDLALLTLRNPRAAAAQIMSLELSRDVLWTTLALVAVANTFVVALLFQISDPGIAVPSYFEAPLTLFVLIAGLMVVFVHAIYWAGLALGGEGKLMDMLALVVWFQILRAVAQCAVILVSFAIPALGLLLSLVVAGYSIWIFLTFVATSMRFRSLMQSVMVVIIAGVGVVLGLGIILSIIGLGAHGAV